MAHPVTRIAKSEMLCHLCGKTIAVGDEYVRDHETRAHVACKAAQQNRLGEVATGGKAGHAKGGRIVRDPRNLGG